MCPELVDAVAATDADVVACYPYLFATTVDAIAVSQVPTVLHPAAHDEPALYLSAFRQSFRDIDGFVYHTQAERDLMEHVFGIGADRRSSSVWGSTSRPGRGAPGATSSASATVPISVTSAGSTSTRDAGCWPSTSTRYKERHPGDLALALVGPVSDKAPEHPDIVVTGTVSEADKWDILAGAEVMVNPSAYESFSLVLLEAWTLGIPVLVNASCAATMEHCRRRVGACGSSPTARSRWRSTGWSPTAACGRDWAQAGNRLHRPLLPVAVDHRPVHPVPRRCGGQGPPGSDPDPAGSPSRAAAPSTFGKDEGSRSSPRSHGVDRTNCR